MLDWALCAVILAAALPFRPWLPLRHGPLVHPWLGAMVLLPLLWCTDRLLPSGMTMHVSSACLMTLMFGWPLAMWSLVPVAFLAGWFGHGQLPPLGEVASHLAWLGLVPGTLGLLIGLLVGRVLHPFGMTAPANSPRQFACRGGGILATFTVLIVAAVGLLLRLS